MKEILIGKYNYPFEKTLIMGILNVTPDSFFDGGSYVDLKSFHERIEKMLEFGADIIDIGGESTRPNHIKVDLDEELSRVMPTVSDALKFSAAVSVDTTKLEVAKQALKAGADMINDVSGANDIKMLELVAKHNASICIMHNSPLRSLDIITEIKEDLLNRAKTAEKMGIIPQRIFLDTGIGFNKDYEQNLEVLSALKEFGNLGYPTLLGVSRKSVIQKTLNVNPKGALNGTLALTALAVMAKVNIVRVHDVKENKEVVKMLEELKNV